MSNVLFQESQASFDGFTEWLQTFELYRGKQLEEVFEDESRVVGKFKVTRFASIKILFCGAKTEQLRQ